MRILMMEPLADIPGPIPQIARLMGQGFEQLGCQVEVANWGQRESAESLLTKVVGRSADIRSVIRQATTASYDVLFFHEAHGWKAYMRQFPISLWLRAKGLPVVYLFHGTAGHLHIERGPAVYRTILGMIVRASVGVFCLSRQYASALVSAFPSVRAAGVRLPFSAASEGYPGPPDRWSKGSTDRMPLRMLFVGRLVRAKGILDLVRAMPGILSHRTCHLIVVGHGPVLSEARSLSNALGVSRNVTFTGRLSREDVWEAMDLADLLVLPGHPPEGFPVVVLEAMAAGLPIVTTRIGGIPDYLQEGVHALYVPPGDPVTLAQTVVDLLEDEDLRRSMSQANLELVKTFEPVSVMSEYLAFIRAWLS